MVTVLRKTFGTTFRRQQLAWRKQNVHETRDLKINAFLGRRDMDHKYVLKKKEDKFIIQEMSETEPGKFALLYEEKFNLEKVAAIVPQGKVPLVEMFRSHNFYPPLVFADRLATGIEAIIKDEDKDSLTIQFNDNEALLSKEVEIEVIVDESELAEIDKLLEDDDEIGDEFDD